MFLGCHQSCPEGFKHKGIFASEVKQYDYCELLSKSLKNDSRAFQEFISIDLEGGLIINHANDLVQLIDKIGITTVCDWIKKGKVDKERLVYVLKAASTDHMRLIADGEKQICD